MTSFREDAFMGREHEGEGGEARDNEGDVPQWAAWLRKVLCDVVKAEVMCMMGAMSALPALIFLGSFLMLTHVDAKVVVLGEGFAADGALKRAWSIKEVDVLMEADIIFLGGTIVALGAFVRFLSSVDAHVDVNFGLVSK